MKYYMFYEGYLLNVNFPLAVVFIVFGLYTVLGNTLVCTVYFIDPFKNLRRNLSFYYVVNLAFADILVGVVVEPLNVSVYWTDSEPALFAFYVFAVLSCVSSILNIAAMMFDRYIAVSQAFRYRVLVTVKRVRVSVVFLWLYAFHFSLLALLGWRDASYQIYLYSFGVFLPSVIMLASYRGLIRILQKKGAKLRRFSSAHCKESTQMKMMMQKERRVSTTVLIMLMVFLLAWFPFVVVDFVLVFCAPCRSQRLLLARDITLSLGFFSSGINPVLYAWRVRQFKQGLLKIMKLGVNGNLRMPRRISKVGPSVSKFSAAAVLELDHLPPQNADEGVCRADVEKIDSVKEVELAEINNVVHLYKSNHST